MTEPSREEGPPFLRTWGQLYGFVLAVLLVVIGLLYGLTRLFSEGAP